MGEDSTITDSAASMLLPITKGLKVATMSNMSNDPVEAAQAMYRAADQTRVRFRNNANNARSYYADLVNFVVRVLPWTRADGTKDLLDIGCGCGWSSFCFAEAGFRTTGLDLNPEAFEPPSLSNLKLMEGSAMELPFGDSSFDVIVCYQCLEHLPAPETAIREMIRVSRPNGVVCIVGPNLVSPFMPLKFLAKEIWDRTVLFKRSSTTGRHPYGNTAYEHIASFFSTTALLFTKLLVGHVDFSGRVPDHIPPFHADNDACYLCNPTDLIKFFRQHGFRILRKGRHGRPPLSYLFAGGTWVVVQSART